MTEASSTTEDGGDFNKFRDGTIPLLATNHKQALLNCCICQKAVTSKKAKLLPCLHTLCSPCEITAMSERKLKCLCCNQYWQDTDITDHFLVHQMDLGLEVAKCDVCTESLIAKFRCQECGDYLCVECGRAHQRVKMTKDHHLKEVESCGSSDTKCSEHPTEDLTWYCFTCDEVTCRNCQLQNHPGHQYKLFQEQAGTYRSELRKMLEENSKKLLRLDQVKNVAMARVQEVTKCENSMRLDLRQTISQIQQALTDRGNQLLAKIERSSENKRRAYLEINSAVESIEAMSKQTSFFMEAALTCTNDIVLHRSLKTVTKSLNIIERLTQEKRSTVNTDLQLQVQLSLNLVVTSLLEQIRNLGEVVIDRTARSRTKSGNQQKQTQNYVTPAVIQTQANQLQQSASISSGPIAHPSYGSRVSPTISPRQNSSFAAAGPVSQNGYTVVNSRRSGPPQAPPGVHLVTQRAQQGIPAQQFGYNASVSCYQQQMAATASRPIQMAAAHQQQQQPVGNMNLQLQQGQRPMQMIPSSYMAAMRMPGSSNVIIQQLSQMDPNQIPLQNYGLQMPPSYANHAMVSGNSVTQAVVNNHMQQQPIVSSVVSQQQQFSTAQPYNFVNQSLTPPSTGVGSMPRLQYGPSMVQNANRSHVSRSSSSSSSPGAQQVPQQVGQTVRSTGHLQRAAGPTQMTYLPQLSVDTSIRKQHPTAAANVLRAQIAELHRSSAMILENHSRNEVQKPAVVIQLSPNPEQPEEYSNERVDNLDKRSSTENELIITNIVSMNKQKDELSADSSTTINNKDQIKSKGDREPNEINEISKPSTTVEPVESTEILNPSSSFNVKPVPRLAKKSIAKLMDVTLERKNKEHEKNDINGSVIATNLKEKNADSPEKFPDYYNDFPMTQPFDNDNVFGDNVPGSISPSNSGRKESPKCIITPLIYKDKTKNNSAEDTIEKPANIFERVTPDASIVTTTTAESCNTVDTNRGAVNEELVNSQDDNRWDDYCSVCQNGGDLMCCEAKDCTRVFHSYHHVPPYTEIPTDSWKCGFCVDPKIFKSNNDRIPSHERLQPGLTVYEQKSCERILLELYCHSESPPFHLPVEPSVPNYYETIKHPMDFSKIREKLNPTENPEQHKYTSVEEYLNDLNRVFINCDIFNEAESDTGKSGKLLAEKYVELANVYFPELLHLVQTTNKNNKIGLSSKRKRRRLKLHSDSEDSSCSSKRSSPCISK